jgi:hypothetical protein
MITRSAASCVRHALPRLVLAGCTALAHAQTTPQQVRERLQEAQRVAPQNAQRGEQAMKDMDKQAPGGIAPCALVSRAEVEKVTGRKLFTEPEPYGSWICSFGEGELKVYRSMDGWEQTMRTFKADKTPRTPAPAFGAGAHFIVMKQESLGYPVAILAANAGRHTLVLSLDGQEGKSAEPLKPMLETLMRSAIARLPK